MPLRAVARLGHAAGDRISSLLHTLVFSLPSPTAINSSNTANITAASAAAAAAFNASTAAVSTNRSYWSFFGKDFAAAATVAIAPVDNIGTDDGITEALETGAVGPLSFVGSGYGMMLVVMAILLNRIHHIVQRPRVPPQPQPHPPQPWAVAWRAHLASALVSPTTHRNLRLPGLLALVYGWVLFSVVTLQAGELWPADAAKTMSSVNWGYLSPLAHSLGTVIDHLGAWGGDKEMGSVCWTTFLCVCAGLVSGALANGLDRARRRDVGASFKLFGFSCLLHLYSSPLTHRSAPNQATASGTTHHGRPDVHALFHLWLGLTELTWLETIELSPTMRRNQLLPTATCGALGLIHFVYTLLTAPLKFPSFTFMTHLLSLLLATVIVCTIVLRAFTFIFTQGYIPSPIWENLMPHSGAAPSIEDDAGVALLKLGTACIESTAYSGLRNELAPVEQADPWVALSSQGCDKLKHHSAFGGAAPPTSGYDTRIDKIQVAELTNPNTGSPRQREFMNFRQAVASLISDIFWTAVLGTPVGRKLYEWTWRAWYARWWYGPRQWQIWRRAAWAGPPPARGRSRMEQMLARMAVLERLRQNTAAGAAASTGWSSAVRGSASTTPVPPPPPPADYTYDQVLRGEVVLEDDDNEYEWQTEDEDMYESGVEVEEMDDEDEDDGEYGDTTTSGGEAHGSADAMRTPTRPRRARRSLTPTADDVARYAAYSDDHYGDIDPIALQPIMLAHMAATTSSPMTRRRYAAMVSSGVDEVRDVVLRQRHQVVNHTGGVAADPFDEERRRSCVVCMVAARDVILWPCRCMLMCNDCRASLAARLAGKDQCPNCRSKVEGYSRVYLP